MLWVLFLLGGAGVGLLLDMRLFQHLFLNPYFHVATFAIGLFILGLVMRSGRNTGRTLAKFGREGNIPRMETNRLVTVGIYSCMRHPMHFGLLLFPFAFAFILGSPSFILIVAPLEIILIILLIKFVEERQAIHKFGSVYREYMRQVPFFSLKPKCLKELFGKSDFRVAPEDPRRY